MSGDGLGLGRPDVVTLENGYDSLCWVEIFCVVRYAAKFKFGSRRSLARNLTLWSKQTLERERSTFALGV